MFVSGTFHLYRPQRSWGKVIFSQASVILFTGGGGIPACIAGGIPACLAGFQAHTQGGSLGGSGRGVSRPTPKGEVEGDLARGGVSRLTPRGRGLLLGGAWSTGVCSWRGGVEPSPLGRLLLQAVRILLECILVLMLRMNRTIKTVLEVFTKSPQY